MKRIPNDDRDNTQSGGSSTEERITKFWFIALSVFVIIIVIIGIIL